jgi:hypothetical protein
VSHEALNSQFHFQGFIMRHARVARWTLLILALVIVPASSPLLAPRVHADVPFTLSSVPAYAQEGNAISLILTANNANGGTRYQFVFFVKDPSGKTFQSAIQNYTTLPGQNQFTLRVIYPSPSMPGTTALSGLFNTWVDSVGSVIGMVAQSSFLIGITDNTNYERTQNVNILSSGYNASESVTVSIRTQTTSTTVFSQAITADSAGTVTSSWKIPKNATIDNYVVTVTGTSTVKNPPDTQTFSVRAATMSIATITSSNSVYQRTDTMQFAFQPTYPDSSIASTGVALLTLARPSGGNVTLTATYNNVSQTFTATYETFVNNQTGTWTASLTGHAYSDAYGNTGPGTRVANFPQLIPATLTVNVRTGTSFNVGQQLKFNTSVTYPDGTILQSGSVGAFLLYSGTQTVNETVPMVFDTVLNLWIGTYTWQSRDTGGLWSLIVRASDSPLPPSTGSATRAITLQNSATGGISSFPLYYFGIIAALIAGALVGLFLIFRRRRVTHANLKIDLEAVKSEAGKIESQDFFRSIKDQVKKDKED